MGGMEDMIGRTNQAFNASMDDEEKFQRLKKILEAAEEALRSNIAYNVVTVSVGDLRWALDKLEQLRTRKESR